MPRIWFVLPVAAGMVLAGLPAKAEISGFELNKIEGVGDLEGKLDDRLVDDQQVSYADCLVYLAGAVPTDTTKPCSADADCPVGKCSEVDGKALCVGCLASTDCVAGDKPLCDVATHTCSAAPAAGGCHSDQDCLDPAKPACAPVGSTFDCVACTDDTYCAEGEVCQISGGTFECLPDDGPAVCETCFASDQSCAFLADTWNCVGCVLDSDCEKKQAGTVCDQGTHQCIPAPAKDSGCAVAPESCPKDKPVCALVNQAWSCVACVTQSDCQSSGQKFYCDQSSHACLDACAQCPMTCVPMGGQWGCVACVDSNGCGLTQVCDPETHKCIEAPPQGECVTNADCLGVGSCVLFDGVWQCLECSDNRDCTDDTKPACATIQGELKCVECAADSDCAEGACDTATHTCGAAVTGTGEKPKILVRWSLSPSSGYDYAIKVGSCSDTGGIGDEATDSCKYVVTRQELPGSTNNEFQVDLRDLIGNSCEFGDSGTASLYFFIQYGDDATTKEVEVVEFEWDYEPPDQPQNIEVSAGEGNLKVSWADESGTGAEEFKVYWSSEQFDDASKVDVDSKGSITTKSYQISGLATGTTYFVGVTAVDAFGNESKLPELLTGTPVSVDDFWEHYQKSGGQEEGGFCFVATAAFGTQMAPSVVTLRMFRDRVLMASPWGRSLVGSYYTYGPLAARFIQGSPVLRFLARTALVPAVALAWVTVEAGATARFAVALLLATLLAVVVRRRIVGGWGLAGPVTVHLARTAMQQVVSSRVLSLCLLAVLASSTARAEETPVNMAAEFRVGMVSPKVDSEFDGGVSPFKDMFGDESAWLFGGELDYQFWRGFGSIGLFGSAAWGYVSGKGMQADGSKSSDATSLSLVPLVVGPVYRFDWLAVRYGIPLVLALKGGLGYTVWWIRDGVDDIASYEGEDGSRREGYGGTFGVHWGVSLHLLLDFFEPHTAKVFDNEMGVNNSYLFVEYTGDWANDFGSDKSFDLSQDGVVFGLAFEM